METVRAFVGCLVDLGTTRKLMELSRTMRSALDAAAWRASWVPPPNLHITLRFLGEIDVGTVPALRDALAVVARRHTALRLHVRDLVALPDASLPQVLAVGVGDERDSLGALARDVDATCRELGFSPEPKPFCAHVTLCRVRHQASALDTLPPLRLDAGVASVYEITLYRSDQGRQGYEYSALSRHPLGAQERIHSRQSTR
jgi:2'-5' RNA ligase